MHLLAHRHKRKRRPLSVQKNSLWLRALDKTTLAVGVIGPMTVIPQILKILELHSAAGVSALAWGSTALFDIPFLMYGLAHKDRVIIVTYSLWFVGSLSILILTVLYS